MNKVCYTAIFGNYEELKEPAIVPLSIEQFKTHVNSAMSFSIELSNAKDEVQREFLKKQGDRQLSIVNKAMGCNKYTLSNITLSTSQDELNSYTGFDFVCFTDQNITSKTWEIIKVEPELPAQRMARKIKILPHFYLPNAQYTFWLDASFQINCDLNDFWNKHFKSPLTAPAHPIRNCVYREIESCIANKRGDEDQLRRQSEIYKAQKVPNFGYNIITSGVLMREKTLGCTRMCEEWWEELSQHSARDQVAFAKISRGWLYHTFKWDYTNNRDLKYIHHYKFRH
jgi:hypothetical protein